MAAPVLQQSGLPITEYFSIFLLIYGNFIFARCSSDALLLKYVLHLQIYIVYRHRFKCVNVYLKYYL